MDFDEFWAQYPRREARKDAMKAWGQTRAHEHADAITAALAWQRNSDSWRRGYVPLAATYLRGERWEDENPAASVQRDPLYPQFERWQSAHRSDPKTATISFDTFKRYHEAQKARRQA